MIIHAFLTIKSDLSLILVASYAVTNLQPPKQQMVSLLVF